METPAFYGCHQTEYANHCYRCILINTENFIKLFGEHCNALWSDVLKWWDQHEQISEWKQLKVFSITPPQRKHKHILFVVNAWTIPSMMFCSWQPLLYCRSFCIFLTKKFCAQLSFEIKTNFNTKRYCQRCLLPAWSWRFSIFTLRQPALWREDTSQFTRETQDHPQISVRP